jgi:hypothetical protein
MASPGLVKSKKYSYTRNVARLSGLVTFKMKVNLFYVVFFILFIYITFFSRYSSLMIFNTISVMLCQCHMIWYFDGFENNTTEILLQDQNTMRNKMYL